MIDEQTIGALNRVLADRYSVEREIGQGGMATVYLARDLKHSRNVAIKVLKPELAAVLGRGSLCRRDQDDGGAAASPHSAVVRFG